MIMKHTVTIDAGELVDLLRTKLDLPRYIKLDVSATAEVNGGKLEQLSISWTTDDREKDTWDR